MDKYLVQFSKDIEALPSSIRHALDEIDFQVPYPQTETDLTPPLLQYADAVSARLDVIRAQPGSGAANSAPLVPSITLEGDDSSPMDPDSDNTDDAKASTTLFASNGKPRSSIWEAMLLRLLHIHCVLHASYGVPEGPSGGLVAILGVLLCVFSSDDDDDDDKASTQQPDHTRILDAEASAFWAMESLISGLREALEEETGPADPTSASVEEGWKHTFSRMLCTVDAPLWDALRRNSLDPALPYYTNRWIPTLFTHTLHMHEVLPIWDAMFTLPAFAHHHDLADSDSAAPPQVEFLLDVGVTMLTRARVSLLLLGKKATPSPSPGHRKPRSLWAEEQFTLPASSSNLHTPAAYSPVGTPRLLISPPSSAGLGGLVGGEVGGDAFLKGLKILQAYDVEEYGGIERVLHGAWGLYAKRISRGAMVQIPSVRVNGERASENGMPQMSRFDRLAEVVWRGLTNEESSPPSSPSLTAPPSPGAGAGAAVVVPKFELTAPSPISNRQQQQQQPGGLGLGFGARIRDTLWKGVTNQVDSSDGSEPSPEPSPVASRSSSPLLVATDDAMNLEQEQKHSSAGGGGSGGGGGWFGGFGDLDAAAVLAKTSTNLRVRAMDVLGRTSPKPEPHQPQPQPQPQPVYENPTSLPPPPSGGGGSWVASLTAFRLGLRSPQEEEKGDHLNGVVFDARSRHGSLPTHQAFEREVVASTSKDDLYSPPPRPPFRPARDSISSFTASPTMSPSSPSVVSEPSPSKGGTSAIQSALAALTGSSSILAPAPAPAKKSGPKPLFLNSKALMTSPLSPRTPSRSVSPAPPRNGSSASGQFRSASSSRNSSVDHQQQQLVPGASGVVPLRRGPITSARMVGGPNAGRAFNSRDSISSTGSNNRYSSDYHRFSYEESMSAGERERERERESRAYSLGGRTKTAGSSGFIVDRGGMDSPVTPRNRDSNSTGTSGARTSPPQSLHPEEGGGQERVVLNDGDSEDNRGTTGQQESDDDITIPAGVLLRVDSDESASEAERAVSSHAKLRAKRHRDPYTSAASDLNSEAGRNDNLGDHTFTSPPSAGFGSSLLEPGIGYDAYDDHDASTTPTPATPNLPTIERKGATVNRSRTPRGVRRPHKGTGTGTGEEDTARMSRRSGNPSYPSYPSYATSSSRDSTALVSGSEEEGARADVEDEFESYN
jgi:hypothetical protein